MTALSGRLFLCESPGWFWYQDDGTQWNAWGMFQEYYAPVQTLTWVNQGPAGVSTTDGPTVLTTPGNAGDSLRMRVENVSAEEPTAAPYKLVVGFMPTLDSTDQTSCGVVFRESGTDKVIYFSIKYDTTVVSKSDFVISLDKYDNATTYNSTYKVISANPLKGSTVWLRVTDTGTDLRWSYSPDGLNFTILDEHPIDDFFTTGPNQIGIAVNSNDAAASASMVLLSWFKDTVSEE